jgi:hypothetical protein
MRAMCPSHLILLVLVTLKYSVKNTGYEIHHYAILSSLLDPDIILSTLLSKILSYAPPSKLETKFRTHTAQLGR